MNSLVLGDKLRAIIADGSRSCIGELLFPKNIPLILHPQMDAVIKRNNAWVRSHLRPILGSDDMVDYYVEHQVGVWCCGVFPSASAGRVQSITDWTSIWLLIDDFISLRMDLLEDPDKANKMRDGLQNVLRGTPPNPDDTRQERQ